MNFKHCTIITAILLLTLTSFAATKPLNSPQGLAVDSKGNLYVANNAGNDILIYNPSYAQMTAKTISKGVASPSAVAIDASGNIWVANLTGGTSATGTVTEYSSTGVLSTTITDGIDYPYAIAIDAIGDIWVENNFNNVTVYPSFGYSSPVPIKTYPFSNPVTGVAPCKAWMTFGGNSEITLQETGPFLSGTYTIYSLLQSSAYSLACDPAGNLYSGTLQDTLNVSNLISGSASQLVSLGYFPFGVAVDSARGRVYVSDANHNQINAYSTTTGALLHTIK